MKTFTFTLRVEAFNEQTITCHIYNKREDNSLRYSIADGNFSLLKNNQLATVVDKNQHQLHKILRSAIDGRLHVGQIINCVFIDDFHFLKEDNFNSFIRLDRRNGKMDITISDCGLQAVHKIYADGSCNHQAGKSGYGGFIEAPDGTRKFFFRAVAGGSSNLMELLAIKDGLQRLAAESTIQVNTDSRFVIRGLVQWVHFWNHNNYKTSYGREVRYARHWQEAYTLCADKYIEFKWIKAHSGNVKHNLCHMLAKAAALAAVEQ